MDQLRALKVLVRVIDEGSFAAASRALDLAPAVVTRVIAELEAHLGARLLNRTTRRLALTEAGDAYLERARRILEQLDEADALAGVGTQALRGTLRVLCPPAFAVHQLAPKLMAFRARHPQLGLDVSTPGAVELADPHHDASIVSVGRQPLSGDFVARRLARSDFVLCAAPDYLRRRGEPREPEELLPHDVVLPAVAAVRREVTLYRVDAAAGAQGAHVLKLPRPDAALSTGHIDLMLAAALAGVGIAGLPSFAAAAALRDGTLRRVLPAWRGESLTLYAALPTRRQMPARTRAFVDYLVESFGGEDRDPWLAGVSAPSRPRAASRRGSPR